MAPVGPRDSGALALAIAAEIIPPPATTESLVAQLAASLRAKHAARTDCLFVTDAHIVCMPKVPINVTRAEPSQLRGKDGTIAPLVGEARLFSGADQEPPPLYRLPASVVQAYALDFAASAYDDRLQMALRMLPAEQLATMPPRFDHFISHRFPSRATPTIRDQHGTGRCWLFAANNAARYSISASLRVESSLHSREPDIAFSNTYLWFYHLLEGANSFLEAVTDAAGAHHDSAELARLVETPIEQVRALPPAPPPPPLIAGCRELIEGRSRRAARTPTTRC